MLNILNDIPKKYDLHDSINIYMKQYESCKTTTEKGRKAYPKDEEETGKKEEKRSKRRLEKKEKRGGSGE